MSNRHEQRAPDVQYEPDESPPALVSLGSGLQLVVLGITSIIFIPSSSKPAAEPMRICPGLCSARSLSVASARLCKRSG